ncbi:MAG: hypothetical protein M3O26_07635 [Pseudomonadota bacterium]|nr:hypothetical protein [Pseudomonadota bacterium]
MFIGHFAVGFAAKRVAPRTNVAVLIAAALFLDILWPIFVLLGWEQVRLDPGNTRYVPLAFTYYPWSHSLVMSMLWASAFALVYYAAVRYRPGALMVWIAVVSHWILDWISHGPDMPLYPDGPRVGLALWNSISGTMIVETLLFAGGVGLYISVTRARDRVGHYAFSAYVIFLLSVYISERFSEPPSSVYQVAVLGVVASAVLIPWPWWFDGHRDVVPL